MRRRRRRSTPNPDDRPYEYDRSPWLPTPEERQDVLKAVEAYWRAHPKYATLCGVVWPDREGRPS
jgi:hypothetical protein